ncbi:MAG: Rieske (2Fe-2S) protein [Candidatus Thermoplasmatota archaeon]|nr:Rieske (2Fe-2S) protein [Candidatus Sysuiplasma jiujiangense]MCL4317658.1 Rieske (2Fe-2S) protein [Candidatus Thermoplasmatota archaeon]
MAWQFAANIDEMPATGLFRAEVEGKEILLIRSGEKIFATSLRCTHENDDLSTGTIENGNIVCGFHYATYSPSTGEVLAGPEDGGDARPLQTFNVKIEGSKVLVDV